MADYRCSTCETVLDGNATNAFTCQRCGIRARLENSSLRGLVPPEFEIIGEEIEFTPTEKFWEKWRMDICNLEAIGVRVYGIPNYRKPKPDEWRVRVLMMILDTLKDCECGAKIDERDSECFACRNPTHSLQRRNAR